MACEELCFVVLNYNSEKMTIECVDKLLSFSLDFHIVIVDNNSPDGSYQKLNSYYKEKSCDVILSHKNGGYSMGNNIGIRYAEEKYNSKYIAIVNPDVIIPSGSIIEELLATLKNNPRCAVVGANHIETTSVDHYPVSWNIPTEREFIRSKSVFYCNKRSAHVDNSEKLVKVECISGCFFIVTMEALKDIGYLDEDIFMYNEETLLGYKLKQKDYYELLRNDLVFYHNHVQGEAPTLTNFIPKRRSRFASDIVLFKKLYGSKMGLGILYINGYINICAEYLWFVYKKVRTRITRK